MMNRLIPALALALATPAIAQRPQLVADKKPLVANNAPLVARKSVPLDPARLTAATKLLDTMMPPARRAMMIDSLVAVSNANIAKGMSANPAFSKAFGDDPRVGPIFQKFMATQQSEMRALLTSNLPEMIAAMRNAYARRFSTEQMSEIQSFFASPTGQLYMEKGATVMADPDVSAWQQKMIGLQMAKMPDATRALAAEIMALPPKEGK
jgi:Uncharacterized protein conserved in bacteria (DUF2059)